MVDTKTDITRRVSVQTFYLHVGVAEPDFLFTVLGLEILPGLLLLPLERTVVVLPRGELIDPHGPGVRGGAYQPDLSFRMVGVEVGGLDWVRSLLDLGVDRSEVSLLLFVRQEDVLPKPVRVVLLAPPTAGDVDVPAAALELRPVLLVVAVDEDRVVRLPGVAPGVPHIGLVDVVVPTVAPEPLELPGTNHGGVVGLDHDPSQGPVMCRPYDPPVVGVPVLPLPQLVHEEEILLRGGPIVGGVLLVLVLVLVPAKQEVQALSEQSR